MDKTFRCHHCADVIGVYEPMIVLTDGQARSTSRATEQGDREPVGECYHSAALRRLTASTMFSDSPNPRKPAPFPRSIADDGTGTRVGDSTA